MSRFDSFEIRTMRPRVLCLVCMGRCSCQVCITEEATDAPVNKALANHSFAVCAPTEQARHVNDLRHKLHTYTICIVYTTMYTTPHHIHHEVHYWWAWMNARELLIACPGSFSLRHCARQNDVTDQDPNPRPLDLNMSTSAIPCSHTEKIRRRTLVG